MTSSDNNRPGEVERIAFAALLALGGVSACSPSQLPESAFRESIVCRDQSGAVTYEAYGVYTFDHGGYFAVYRQGGKVRERAYGQCKVTL